MFTLRCQRARFESWDSWSLGQEDEDTLSLSSAKEVDGVI